MSAAYNVFVSWSGTRSKAMGEAFRDWLPHVIQSAVPFFSDKDIASGALWDDSLRASLQSVNFAVVCCTVENVTAPWLNYEAGALVERMKGGTAPWLLDGRPEELQPSPLSRLQAKAADPVGTLAVLQALNESLPSKLAPGILDSAFQTHWPKLEAKLKAIPVAETKAPQRDQREMLEEIVSLTRQIANDMPTKPTLEELTRKNIALENFFSGSQGPQGFNIPPARRSPVTFHPSRSFGTNFQDDDTFDPEAIKTREFREVASELIRNMQSHLGIAKLDHKAMLTKVLSLIAEGGGAEAGVTYGKLRAQVAACVSGAV